VLWLNKFLLACHLDIPHLTLNVCSSSGVGGHALYLSLISSKAKHLLLSNSKFKDFKLRADPRLGFRGSWIYFFARSPLTQRTHFTNFIAIQDSGPTPPSISRYVVSIVARIQQPHGIFQRN